MRMMIKDSIIAMLMLGTRICMAKYCSKIISPWTFIKLNLYIEFLCAAFIMILSLMQVVAIPFSTYWESNTMGTGFSGGAFFVCAEICVVMALNEGPTGPVTAVISFNAIIISVITWVAVGIALTWMQMIGIAIAFVGILVVSSAKE